MTAAGDWFALDHPHNDTQIMRVLAEELEAHSAEVYKAGRHRMAVRIEERRIEALKFCKWKCGQTFSDKQELNDHEECSCPLKIVTCPNACGEEGLQQCNLYRHMREFCSTRSIKCKCGQYILSEDMKLHEEQMCLLRLIDCPKCNAKVTCNMRSIHDNETCPKRLLECPNGCEKMILAEDMESHARSESVTIVVIVFFHISLSDFSSVFVHR